MNDEKQIKMLLNIFTNEQQILQRTDQKAFTLLSLIGMFSVFFIVHYTAIEANIFNLICILAYFVAVSFSILYLLRVISPRIKDRIEKAENGKNVANPTFFAGIVKYASYEEYAEELRKLLDNSEDIYKVFSKSVYSMAEINAYKNRAFRKGMTFFLMAIGAELLIILALFLKLVLEKASG